MVSSIDSLSRVSNIYKKITASVLDKETENVTTADEAGVAAKGGFLAGTSLIWAPMIPIVIPAAIISIINCGGKVDTGYENMGNNGTNKDAAADHPDAYPIDIITDKIDAQSIDVKDVQPIDIYQPDAMTDPIVPDVITDIIVSDSNNPDCQDAAKTCEPGPCSTVLNVPADYPTIQEAIAAAGQGDIVKIAKGDYIIDKTIILKDCLHIGGEGIGLTNLISNINSVFDPSLEGDTITGSSIEGVSLKSLNENSPADGKGWIDLYYASISIKKSELNLWGWDSQVTIEENVAGYLTFGDGSYADLKNNTIKHIDFYGGSSGKVRGNLITGFISYSYAGIDLFDTATPDLGTIVDPGNNYFLNCYEPQWPFYSYFIVNRTQNLIQVQGNYFESENNNNCDPPNLSYGTYEEMLAHPDPFDPGSNIETIHDWHDNPAYGVVDYSGFKKMP